MWVAIGVLVIGAIFVAGLLTAGSTAAAAVVTVVAVVASAGARRAIHRGRRLSAPEADALLATDTRRPVVYLRSFERDETPYVPTLFSRRHRRVFPRLFLLFGVTAQQPQTHEERLARALRATGPLVAIGDPRDTLPDLGAARVYVDDHWQAKILDLIGRAELVVLEAEASDGLTWEVSRVVENVAPERVVLSLPVDRGGRPLTDRYDAFRQRTEGVFPAPLPVAIEDAQFIVFDEGWTPLPFAPTRRPSDDPVELHCAPAERRAVLEHLRDEFRLHTVRFVLRLVPYGLVALLAVGVVIAIAVDSGGSDPYGAPAAAPRSPVWHTVGRQFGFSIRIPGRVTTSSTKTPVTGGVVAVTHEYGAGRRGAWFEVAYTRLVGALASASVVEGAAYVRGDSLYEVAAAGRPDTPQWRRMQTFLRSFRLVE